MNPVVVEEERGRRLKYTVKVLLQLSQNAFNSKEGAEEGAEEGAGLQQVCKEVIRLSYNPRNNSF